MNMPQCDRDRSAFVSLSSKASVAENLKPGHNGHGCNPSK